VLFNNAGIALPGDGSVLGTSLRTWNRVIEANLTSSFLCCKYGIPYLLQGGGGSVINTSSLVARMGSAVSQIAYTASNATEFMVDGGISAAYVTADSPAGPNGGG
jgi:NAD(P)-dependent dehydrogenase (short-subunit alcohol dehydrogenase family)